MPSPTRSENKIDVLDMLITILKDHEESLSDIVDRLGAFIGSLSLVQKKSRNLDQISQQETLSHITGKLDVFIENLSSIIENIGEFASENGRRLAVADCRKWSEFKEVSTGASLVAYETDMWNIFSISSLCREFVFRYSERLPVSQNDMMPGDSVCHKVLNLEPSNLRRWLSKELKVSKDKIVEGNLIKSLAESNQYVASGRKGNA